MNLPVFAFAVAVAAVCGVLFGVAPALRASRTPLVETLKDGGRGGTGIGQRRAQRLLVVSEIALALMLSVGAGLMIRSFAALQRVSPGFEPAHLLTFRLSAAGCALRHRREGARLLLTRWCSGSKRCPASARRGCRSAFRRTGCR